METNILQSGMKCCTILLSEPPEELSLLVPVIAMDLLRMESKMATAMVLVMEPVMMAMALRIVPVKARVFTQMVIKLRVILAMVRVFSFIMSSDFSDIDKGTISATPLSRLSIYDLVNTRAV